MSIEFRWDVQTAHTTNGEINTVSEEKGWFELFLEKHPTFACPLFDWIAQTFKTTTTYSLNKDVKSLHPENLNPKK